MFGDLPSPSWALALFSNEQGQRWLHRPNTILVDSRQLESGESMSDDFKKLAAHQLEELLWDRIAQQLPANTKAIYLCLDGDLTRELLSDNGRVLNNWNGKEPVPVPGVTPPLALDTSRTSLWRSFSGKPLTGQW